MGIDPRHRDRIFRPYFTTKKQGTGLGLFVTHRIVGEYGGTVVFESVEGVGTIFRVRLPLRGEPPIRDRPPEQHEALQLRSVSAEKAIVAGSENRAL
jgi:nitrogen-specific signal transduction histidine kinase